MKEECTGAGIIVYYDNRGKTISDIPEKIVYLVLIDNKGYYDFPKGGIEFGEYPFDCALRETYEEINLSEQDFEEFSGKIVKDKFSCGEGLVMFIGKIKKDSFYNTVIKANEKSGYFEHSSYEWLDKNSIVISKLKVNSTLKMKLPLYLQECLSWASQKIV